MAFVQRVDGVLRGMDREAGCKLEIWEESSSTGRVFLRCRITDDPADLPGGEYMLFVGDHRIATRKFEGHWLLRYLPKEIRLEEAA